MAWNPSPEVAVARDAAQQLARCPDVGEPVNRCIVLYTTETRMGYASYGATRPECGQARRLADAAYEAITGVWDTAIALHERPPVMRELDWGKLREEVVGKLALLEAAATKAEMTLEVRGMIMRDLVMPNVELLARFCMAVTVEEED